MDQPRSALEVRLKVRIAFYDLCASPSTPTRVVTPPFAWGIVNQRAFYVARATLSLAGARGAAMATTDASGQAQTAKIQFSVYTSGPVLADGRQQPVLANGNFVAVKATEASGLQTEPFIFVIDGQGRVVDEFEAVVAPQELDAAIAKAMAGG